jgi:hypothetical protein
LKIYQCDPTIPVNTPKGSGYCIAWIDYSQEHDTLWKCVINSTGQVWDFPQNLVRGVKNISMNRLNPEKLHESEA